MVRENALDSIRNEAANDWQELVMGRECQRIDGDFCRIYLVCMTASTGCCKQGWVSRNRTYQPVFVLGIRIPNKGDRVCEVVTAADRSTYQHIRAVTNGFELARAG